MHFYQRGMVELRKQLRFVDEAAQPGEKSLHVLARLHRNPLRVAARREHRGHVFLQRHGPPQRMIVCAIDDAETAFAERAEDLELVHAGAGRQRSRRACSRLFWRREYGVVGKAWVGHCSRRLLGWSRTSLGSATRWATHELRARNGTI